MASAPRVITVDPTWTISRVVRAAVDLTYRAIVQIDVPDTDEALAEVSHGGAQLVVAAYHADDSMTGAELAQRVRQLSPQTAVIILGDVGDTTDADAARADAPFVYLRRPVDVVAFMRVLMAGLDGRSIFSALEVPATSVNLPLAEMGAVPPLDLKAAQVVIDTLLADVGAMAIILSSRSGEVLLERGAVGYLDREKLTNALLPMIRTTINMGGLVGGQPTSLQFYDGESYDVFVLSIGFHHFMSLVFDGALGVRQFGAVTRFGRRASEDLRALLGASAFNVQPLPPEEKPRRKAVTGPLRPLEPAPAPLAVKADTWEPETPEPPAEEAAFHLEPIENFDMSIFDKLEGVDGDAADDLFDPQKLADIANESRRGHGPISYDEARDLGIVP